MNSENAYIVFTDLKGFSKLTEDEIKIFYKNILLDLSKKIIHLKKDALVWNTWGDALVAIFKDEEKVIELVFKYRDFFKKYDFEEKGIKELYPRIACHYGEFDVYKDPLLDKNNALGTDINTTARIEPVTHPKEIYVTQEFKDKIKLSSKKLNVAFDELGEVPLAKNYGSFNLYRLRKKDEKPKIIYRIIKQDLAPILPKSKPLTDSEKESINSFANSSSQNDLLGKINLDSLLSNDNVKESYLLEIAKVCKNFALYEEALEIIEKIEQQKLNVDGIGLPLCKYHIPLIKLKANCLTRLGRYEEASDIIYGIWQLNNKDSDTLSMLAAQYKRRALIDKNGEIKKEPNFDLLNRALKLYIEAFRLNIEDYYPAINIAYLYKIKGGEQKGRGIKLAKYIQDIWENNTKDWWLASTLLECDIIQDDLENIDKKLDAILKEYKPNYFERKAVYEQINLYKEFVDDSIKKILEEKVLGKLEV